MEKQTCASRIEKALSIKSMSQTELCLKTGIPKSAMSQYVNGSFEPKQDRVKLIADALEVSEAWLMGYDLPMQKELDIFAIKNILPSPKTKKVPRLGSIACGVPILAEENIEAYDFVDERLNCDFTLNCKGDSMVPKLHENDVVLIRLQPDVENGEIAAVLIGDEATLKRVHKNENSLVLTAENPVYPPLIYMGEQLDNIRIIGKAVGLVRFF